MNKFREFLLGPAVTLLMVAVELILAVVSMWAISPPGFYKIAFVSIAVVLVVFQIRAWLQGHIILWVLLVCITLFFDVSATLAATKLKSDIIANAVTQDNDPLLLSIRQQLQENRAILAQRNNDFAESARSTTIDSVLGSRTDIERKISDLEAQELDRIAQIGSGQAEKSKAQVMQLTSAQVFYSIEDALKSRRLELIVWLAIFSSIQFIIVFSLSKLPETEEVTAKLEIMGTIVDDIEKVKEYPIAVELSDHQAQLVRFLNNFWPQEKEGELPTRQFLERHGYSIERQQEILKSLKDYGIYNKQDDRPTALLGKSAAVARVRSKS